MSLALEPQRTGGDRIDGAQIGATVLVLEWTYRHRLALNRLALALILAGFAAPLIGFTVGALAFVVGVPLLLLGLYNIRGDHRVSGGASSDDPNISAALKYESGGGGN